MMDRQNVILGMSTDLRSPALLADLNGQENPNTGLSEMSLAQLYGLRLPGSCRLRCIVPRKDQNRTRTRSAYIAV